MPEITFTKHARERLQERNIDEAEVIETITNPDEILFDSERGNLVAVKGFGDTYLIVIFSPTKPLKIISIIQTSKLNIVENRVKKGRWVRL